MKNTIFNFDLFFVYLGGPIQYSNDGGSPWRLDVAKRLVEIGIPEGQIFDPCNKPLTTFDGDDLDANLEHLNDLRDNAEWETIERISRHTIRVDLRSVDKSDLVYMHIDPTIHTCGTYDEMSFALGQKKPVIAVIDGGIKNAPYWLIGRIGSKNIFPTDQAAIEHIRSIMHGEKPFDAKRWLFMGRRSK